VDDVGQGDVPWIRVVPRFESDELPALLAEATVAGFPSYIEAFGLGVLELMAAGVPTVAYDIPGPRETLGRVGAGLLVPVGKPEALSGRIGELLDDEALYQKVAHRCEAEAQHFSWDFLADQTVEIYRERLDAMT
jgi:glycosyltransferase involved in cell wall biosynthesis